MGSHKISTLSRRAPAESFDEGPSGITSKGETSSKTREESAREVLSEGVVTGVLGEETGMGAVMGSAG